MSVDGRVGRIVLNRPKALNALTLEMIRAMRAALDRWADDAQIGCVHLTGAGGRGLCAGGDLRAIWESRRKGDGLAGAFWREEYALNARIAAYPKPFVAIMDGIVMGGGVGISAHASRRIVTERTRLAMPEVGIGFCPDVGGTWLLSRAPGEVGTWMALTGEAIGAADAIFAGLADRHVPADRLDALAQALARPEGGIDEVLSSFAVEGQEPGLRALRPAIDRTFGFDSVERIQAALGDLSEDWARAALTAMRAKSPTSLKLALAALRRARRLPDLASCLAMEYRIARRLFEGHDFIEGIRATVVDKDRAPRWSPASLEAVTDAMIEAYFAPMGADELAPGLIPHRRNG